MRKVMLFLAVFGLAGLIVLSLILCGCSRQGKKASSAAAEQMGKDLTSAFNSHDIDKLLSFYTDDIVYEDVPFGKIIHGKEEYRPFIKEFIAGAPDIKMELKSIMVSGDRYCMETIVSGTHTGHWQDLPATGKSFSSRGVSVGELRDGKIKQNTDYYDGSSLIGQLGIQPPAMAADPHVGTWKMNVAKSKFDPGPPPKSDTVTFTAQDNGIKLFDDYVDADGKAYHLDFAVKYDGKDYPIKGNPDWDTVAYRKIDPNTFDIIFKKGGKEVTRGQDVFSEDGKKYTFTEKAKNAKGQDVNNTFVYNKQ